LIADPNVAHQSHSRIAQPSLAFGRSQFGNVLHCLGVVQGCLLLKVELLLLLLVLEICRLLLAMVFKQSVGILELAHDLSVPRRLALLNQRKRTRALLDGQARKLWHSRQGHRFDHLGLQLKRRVVLMHDRFGLLVLLCDLSVQGFPDMRIL
jgi:hypothetical protein